MILAPTFSNLPIIFVGGVIRNKYIRRFIEENINHAMFGDVELSSDNQYALNLKDVLK